MLKKLTRTKSIVLIFSMTLLASCGGGGSSGGGGSCGGGDDCVSFAFDGGASTVRTETFDLVPPNQYDPYITASHTSANNMTSLKSYYGYNIDTNAYAERLEIAFFGNATGTYQVSSTSIIYTSASNPAPYTSIQASGDIIVSTYEGAGGHIQGSFDVTVCTVTTIPCPNGSTKQMTGTFYVTLETF